MRTKLIALLASTLLISGCPWVQKANEVCNEAQAAVGLICSTVAVIPIGAAGQEVTDPMNPDCVILTSPNAAPLEYCGPAD